MRIPLRKTWLFFHILLVACACLDAATNTFTNGTGNDLWGTAANWSLGTVPVAADTVVVPAGTTVVVSADDSAAAASLSLQEGAVIVLWLDTTGWKPVSISGTLSFSASSFLVVEGINYEALDGYFPVLLAGSISGYGPANASFANLGTREPSLVQQSDGLWLRLTAPRSYSDLLGTLAPPSTVNPDYAGTEFSATRDLQPTVSAWTPTFHEGHVMDAQLSQQVTAGGQQDILSWDMRIGRGGQIYSLRTPALGETVPPSWRSDPNDSPWNDEVWQGVAVDRVLNQPNADPPSKYFLHQSGVYMRDPILTEPFYCPQVAYHMDPASRSYTSVNWIQHPHVEIFQDGTTNNDWRSDMLTFTRYKDLGQGVIEVTLGFYNYGEDTPDRHNMPWGGVRRTTTEYAFVSNPDGMSWSGPVTEGFGEGRVDILNNTGGWIAFSDSPAGVAPALGLVIGRDDAPRIPGQWSDSLFRLGYAGGTDNGTEAGWRNYFVATLVRNFTLTRGKGVWARYYFVLGQNLTDLANRIEARNLADGTELWAMDYSESDTPLIGYSFSGSGSTFSITRSSNNPRFHLYAHPVDGSFPIYEIIESDGSRHLTWDPYTTGVIKTYDGTIAGIRLLGFALRTTDVNNGGTSFPYASLDAIMAAAPGSYIPSGEALSVRTDMPLDQYKQQVEALADLTAAPAIYADDGQPGTPASIAAGEVKTLFYDALDYKGNPTRVHAWVGIPAGASAENPAPAMVLAHGGGGTAFKAWVDKWVARGYAAIAMGLEGQTDVAATQQQKDAGLAVGNWLRHAMPGPARAGIYGDSNEALEDQWMYHAVADVILAHSLMRSLPEVDASKVGLMGISWGGVIASTVIGIDDRFAFAIPTYGNGHKFDIPNQYGRALGNNSLYKEVWDPVQHIGSAGLPVLWLSWPQENNFSLDSQGYTYHAAVNSDRMVSLVPGMLHGHPPAWNRPESYAFADSVIQAGIPWGRQVFLSQSGDAVRVIFKSDKPLYGATLVHTTGTGYTGSLTWNEVPADSLVEGPAGTWTVNATLPPATTGWFINAKAAAPPGFVSPDLIVSSDYREVIDLQADPASHLVLDHPAFGNPVNGTIHVTFTGPTNVEILDVQISAESHPGAFSISQALPPVLDSPAPSTYPVGIRFDNAVAGLGNNGSARATLTVTWEDQLDGTTDQREWILTLDAYSPWVAGFGLSGSNALAIADPDKDGLSNQLEYALGGDPTVPDNGASRPALVSIGPSGSFVYLYLRRTDAAARGLTYSVTRSTTLLGDSWSTTGTTESGVAIVDAGFEEVTVDVDGAAPDPVFARLQVELVD